MFGFLVAFIIIFLGAVVIAVILGSSEWGEEPKQTLPYKHKQYFFSRSEQQFFNILNAKLDASLHTVFPKVRLGDFIQVSDLKNNYGDWARIRARHVDFLVWDLQNQKILLAIELDGNSHNNHKAKETDSFKDEVFETIGRTLVRVRVGTDFQSEIDKILQKLNI